MSAADFAMRIAMQQNLLSLAMSYAQSRGYEIGYDCLTNLSALFENTAVRMQAANLELTASSHETALRRLVDAMIEEVASRFPDDRTLHEWSLSGALSRVCPLFPFC